MQILKFDNLKLAMRLAASNSDAAPTGDVTQLGSASLDNLAASIRNADSRVRRAVVELDAAVSERDAAQQVFCDGIKSAELDIHCEPEPTTTREIIARLVGQ